MISLVSSTPVGRMVKVLDIIAASLSAGTGCDALTQSSKRSPSLVQSMVRFVSYRGALERDHALHVCVESASLK